MSVLALIIFPLVVGVAGAVVWHLLSKLFVWGFWVVTGSRFRALTSARFWFERIAVPGALASSVLGPSGHLLLTFRDPVRPLALYDRLLPTLSPRKRVEFIRDFIGAYGLLAIERPVVISPGESPDWPTLNKIGMRLVSSLADVACTADPKSRRNANDLLETVAAEAGPPSKLDHYVTFLSEVCQREAASNASAAV